MQMVQSGRYVQALPVFKEMAAKNPRDPSINYYLGLCAQSAHEYDLAELAFSRILVGTAPASPFVPLAKRQLLTLPHKLDPQCALTNGRLYRWQTGKVVRIWISDGRMIPGTGTTILSQEKFTQVVDTLRSSNSRLAMTPGYTSADAGYLAEGIRAWDWAVREKMFSYTFVRDPRAADVLIYFSEAADGNTQYPFLKTQPVLVCIGMSAPDPDHKREHRKFIMAHEFGHSLGLWHGNDAKDLMAPLIDIMADAGRQAAESITSANDKASLRALYSMPPDTYF
jgi:predicted Zn-dependent protease